MMKFYRCLTGITFCGALLTSCSSTKFVGEGEYLLDRVIIEADTGRYNPAELKQYLRQQPNFKTFGLTKWQLYVYNWSGKDGSKWLNKLFRRIGEAPVILDTALVKESAEELERFLINKGYTDASVTASIDTARRKKATVTWRVASHEPYAIREYKTALDDPVIDSIAHLKPPARNRIQAAFRPAPDDYIPVTGAGYLFDRDLLDRERQRITTLLRRRGYYAFNRDYLVYRADSSFSRHVVDLEMRLLPYRRTMPDGTTAESPHRRYYIKDVTVQTDYNPLRLDGDAVFIPTDTVRNGSLSVIYGKNGRTLRPGLLNSKNYLLPGALFSERSLEQTYFAFLSLPALRNVNIRFTETEENDTMKLSALILTSPAKTHGFGFELDGTFAAGDFGAAPSVNYQHRNLLKGSELLSVKLRAAYESLSGGDKEFGLDDYWEVGGEASLSFPQFLFPFVNENFRRRIHASTEFKLSYNRQTRPEYKRAVVSGRWSYLWQSRTSASGRHEVNLMDIDYLFLPRISKDFLESLPQATLQYNYIDQFIVSSSYTYTFNNYNPQYRQRNTHSLRASFELAGNTLYALSKLFRFPTGKNGRYELFGIEYSQFAKTDFDFSRGIILDNRSKLAFHIGLGIAFPYGNANQIPFEQRYFSGGANSVRGWQVRSLGPGSMPVTDSTTFISQTGDIRLDVNLEYRTRLFWKFELAAFADAGNVWTVRPYATQKEGNFDFKRFYKEIAFSYGLGLRLDFDYFLFRFDAGWKAYDPQQQGARRWAISRPNFTDNFAWHFAVGYPF